ncbi:MAG: nicotinate phosphoribosyltransferase [Myxococcota bacterium]
MASLADIYRTSLALSTDLYQLTMAYGYWRAGRADTESIFHLYFRKNPFGGGYTVACGLHRAIAYLETLAFEGSDLAYLAELAGNDGSPLFDSAFLDELRSFSFSCDVDAVSEGTVVFPQEPLVRVQGPIAQCQLIETFLLNALNFESLVATKAARMAHAARGDAVLEFGLRRAQGFDGALSASRAAYVGGADGTSNVFAGKHFGIPVRGTHAHSWVMLFEDELEAFERYADALPNNCVFLVDTYDSLRGVEHAIQIGRRLREAGHTLSGIRLDSGDLAYLSQEARKHLDAAGFEATRIVASNDLDERLIASLKAQGAAISTWGVGTQLVTAFDQPALGGVYKLAAIKDLHGQWQPRIKLSEQAVKTSIPGRLQVRRYESSDGLVADLIYDELRELPESGDMVDPFDPTRRRSYPSAESSTDLLTPIFRGGERVYDPPTLGAVRAHREAQVRKLHPGLTRFDNPHQYPVGLEHGAHRARTALIFRLRGHRE